MINLGFTANAAGISPAGDGPAGSEPDHRSNRAGAGSNGFFGVLLTLFAAPRAAQLPIFSGGAAGRLDADPVMPARNSSPEGSPNSKSGGGFTHRGVIVNGGLRALRMEAAYLAAPLSGRGAPGDSGPGCARGPVDAGPGNGALVDAPPGGGAMNGAGLGDSGRIFTYHPPVMVPNAAGPTFTYHPPVTGAAVADDMWPMIPGIEDSPARGSVDASSGGGALVDAVTGDGALSGAGLGDTCREFTYQAPVMVPVSTGPKLTYQGSAVATNVTGDIAPVIAGIESSPVSGPVDAGPGDGALSGVGPGDGAPTVAGRNPAITAGSHPVPAHATTARVTGIPPGSLQDLIDWAIDLQPAERHAGSGLPIQGAHSTCGDPAHAGTESRNTLTLERPPTLDGRVPGEETVLDRPGDFSSGGLLRVGAEREQPHRSQTLEAFARTAVDGAPLRPALIGDNGGQVMTMVHGRGGLSTEETNAAPVSDARSAAARSSISKAACAGRVEPPAAREDVEGAFIFTSPRETTLSDGESATTGEAWARAVVSRVHDETVHARAAGRSSLSFEITTGNGEIVRVRIAIRSNVVSGRIGVMNAETKEILALHIPQLHQRLEMENLVPERFDVYLMNGGGEGGRRGGQRKSRWAAHDSDEEATRENLVYFASEPKTFEKWA